MSTEEVQHDPRTILAAKMLLHRLGLNESEQVARVLVSFVRLCASCEIEDSLSEMAEQLKEAAR
jgi:hypothetical protein